MLIFAVLSMLFTLPGAAQQSGGGGGGGGGTGGEAPEDFSELVVALREVSGEPILAGPYTVIDEHTGASVDEYCVQPVSPVALPGMDETDAIVNPVDGSSVWLIPLNADLVPLDPELEVCDPQAAYAMYVSEAELERLNMARTSEDVVDQKLADVVERLTIADELTLDGAGRLVIDGAVVDAGPEHAALFQELMKTGTLPSLPDGYTDTDGQMYVDPFGAEELAAASIGAAASKFARISVDAVIYYISNITKVSEVADGLFPQLPAMTGTDLRFLDFSDFTYNRADTFSGAVTWLNVPDLRWETSWILDVVDWAPIPPIAGAPGLNEHDRDVPGIAGFALMVDDVRATILYHHEYEALVGFYMDSPGENTYDQQVAALTAPVTQWGSMPATVVQTEVLETTGSLYYPQAATTTIDPATLQVTMSLRDDPSTPEVESLSAADADLIAAGTSGDTPIAFTFDGGTLVGTWRVLSNVAGGYRDDPPVPFDPDLRGRSDDRGLRDRARAARVRRPRRAGRGARHGSGGGPAAAPDRRVGLRDPLRRAGDLRRAGHPGVQPDRGDRRRRRGAQRRGDREAAAADHRPAGRHRVHRLHRGDALLASAGVRAHVVG